MNTFSNGSHWMEIKDNLLLYTGEDLYPFTVYWKNGTYTKYSKCQINKLWLAEYAMKNCIQSNINQ